MRERDDLSRGSDISRRTTERIVTTSARTVQGTVSPGVTKSRRKEAAGFEKGSRKMDGTEKWKEKKKKKPLLDLGQN